MISNQWGSSVGRGFGPMGMQKTPTPRFGQSMEIEVSLDNGDVVEISRQAMPKIEVKPQVTPWFADKIKGIMKQMPQPMMRALEEKKMKVIISRNMLEGFPRWMKPVTRLREKRTLAAYLPKYKAIIFPERTIPKLFSKKDKERGVDEQTVYHEFGHAVDYLLGETPLRKRPVGKALGLFGTGAGVLGGAVALSMLVPQIGLGFGLLGMATGYTVYRGVETLSPRTSASKAFLKAYKADRAYAESLQMHDYVKRLGRNPEEAFANMFSAFFFRDYDTRINRKLFADTYDFMSTEVMPRMMDAKTHQQYMLANEIYDSKRPEDDYAE